MSDYNSFIDQSDQLFLNLIKQAERSLLRRDLYDAPELLENIDLLEWLNDDNDPGMHYIETFEQLCYLADYMREKYHSNIDSVPFDRNQFQAAQKQYAETLQKAKEQDIGEHRSQKREFGFLASEAHRTVGNFDIGTKPSEAYQSKFRNTSRMYAVSSAFFWNSFRSSSPATITPLSSPEAKESETENNQVSSNVLIYTKIN